jgi:hypothetical protein
MLVLVLAPAAAVAIFLFGVLLITLAVTLRHGDPTATYKLYAVRDGLIEASAFKGVRRGDPWLESLYENVNSVLLHSNLVGGPGGWPLAVAVGHYQASHPSGRTRLRPLPSDANACPEAIRALGPDLRMALEHLARNHTGLWLQVNSREREQRRIQKEKARTLLAMIRADDGRGEAIA